MDDVTQAAISVASSLRFLILRYNILEYGLLSK